MAKRELEKARNLANGTAELRREMLDKLSEELEELKNKEKGKEQSESNK